ncbi:PREDICTED: uncharacterized protein LOC109146716 [Ipomoea nil]|uniref:uncharacterized protein LOC109146716 n=1 Tax=Ipomoea nil TaxID=35883 RepID=UPI000901C250|nr:PREDICTED: uncharacterized protein LOC109146716 [Ipomoea nil]XP_019149919.1 PREDICTED: uncharacterized protein LOC109146716 [Ipomoea nil]XP_019149920.1 PREDICTED: uncharacterized protein LOC109146716 [Ipomoea nil]
MTGVKEVATPMNMTLDLHAATSLAFDATIYRQAIGRLQYLAITRPEISFAVNHLAQYMAAPTELQWQSVKRVLRYLKGTLHYGLHFRGGHSLSLVAYSDSDWGGARDGGRSTTAYVVYFGPNVVSWRSVKQRCVSRSSTEVEFRALANAAAEVMWIQNLLRELGIRLPSSPALVTDNMSATYVCKNPVFHSRMKHLALDYFFVREQVVSGSLRVRYVRSSEQVADLLTKPLGRHLFSVFRSKIGLTDGAPILRGRVEA